MDRKNYVGKYSMRPVESSCTEEYTVLVRNYYDGGLNVMLKDADGTFLVGREVTWHDNALCFMTRKTKAETFWNLLIQGNTVTGTCETGNDAVALEGEKSDILPVDDRENCDTRRKKALILYSSLTGNTEKVACWFKEAFEFYDMDVLMVKVSNRTNWEEYNGLLYIEDYDVVCMGSLIIGGNVTTAVMKAFSAGAGGALEAGVTKNAESGKAFNADGAGGTAGQDMAEEKENSRSEDPMRRFNDMWHRPAYREGKTYYPGGPDPHGLYYPLGIVFTTYGGGFKGPVEALPVLEMLKLYTEAKGCRVIGKFACAGKEFGPAGLEPGERPIGVCDPPVYYKDAQGDYHAGSFFWHAHGSSRPDSRDEATAKAFITHIVEDHFFTADGIRREPQSEYLSIC